MTSHSEPITYALDLHGPAHSTYYPDIASFTDHVLASAETTLIPTARKYRTFVIGYRLEEPRSLQEYFFELLNLGVLWKNYGSTALSVKHAPFRFLARLGEWRKRYPFWKPSIDLLRGVMLTQWLVPRTESSPVPVPRSISDLQRLVAWLEATGDFREDAFRYIRWLAYFSSLNDSYFTALMERIIETATTFEQESSEALGRYTPNVGTFTVQHQHRYRWREDRFSCLRSRTEYHLNMVGAEIMNRSYRGEFLASPTRTVLLPGCMRKRSAEECEGGKGAKGVRCTGCEPSCKVNQLRHHGLRNGFDVMVVPHSTDLAQWRSEEGKERNAVVGVACLSVLVQGGWELKRNNVPAQCVLLNGCGCKKHWHPEGVPTALDVRELLKVVRN